MIVETVITSIWLMVPAYAPNSIAVLAGGGQPIDGGRSLGDERLLGDGKTWRGAVAGTVGGTLLALGMNLLSPRLAGSVIEVEPFAPLAGFGLALGAMLGDICASFLKRRTGRERGKAFPIVDQLDFVAGSLICSSVISYGWMSENLTLHILVTILVITPLIHVGANIIAYLVGAKEEPY